jgi:hypothetical protein
MPRASLNPDKAKQGGGGVENGNYLVESARFINTKRDNKPTMLSLVLHSQVLDADGNPVRGADPVEISFGFGEKSHESGFTPGVGKSKDDADPADQGKEVDAEGNTIYCESTDNQFNASSGAQVFSKSLVQQGFPKELLDQCWAPTLNGLKFRLETMSGAEINKILGTRLNTKPMADGGSVTYKICTKWINPSYINGAESKPTASAPSTTTTAANSGAKRTDEEAAIECLRLVGETRKGPKNAIGSTKALAGFFVNAFAKGGFSKDGHGLPAVRKFVEDSAWVEGQLPNVGGELDYNDEGEWSGKVTFPA